MFELVNFKSLFNKYEEIQKFKQPDLGDFELNGSNIPDILPK